LQQVQTQKLQGFFKHRLALHHYGEGHQAERQYSKAEVSLLVPQMPWQATPI
jgi:hypothetical protein